VAEARTGDHGIEKGLPQTGYVLVNKLTVPLFAFVLLVLIGRTSSRALGEYALVMTYYYLMQTLPLLGLTPFVMREVARCPSDAGRFYVSVGTLAAVTCVAINLAAAAWLPVAAYGDAVAASIRVVGFAIVPGILAFLGEIILISLGRARLVARGALVENILRLVVSGVVLMRGGDVFGLTLVLFGTRTVAFVFYLVALAGPLGIRLPFPDFGLLRRVGSVIPVFAAQTVLGLVVSRLDFITLSLYRRVVTMEDLGYYAIAYRFFEIGLLAVSGVLLAWYPAMSRRYATSRSDFVRHVTLELEGVVLFLLPVVLIAAAMADPYVRILFAAQYPVPVPLARLFALTLLAAGADMFLSTAINAADRQRLDLDAQAVGAAWYGLALIVLIPVLGLYGAWLATLTTFVVQLAMRAWTLRRALRPALDPARAVRIAALAAGLGAVVGLLTAFGGPWASAWVVLALAVGYLPALGWLKLWDAGRLVRVFWRSNQVRDPGTLVGLLDHAQADIRRYHRLRGRVATSAGPASGFANGGLAAVLLYRCARYFHLRGPRLLGRVLWQLNLCVTKADLPAWAPIGPGLLLPRPVGVVIAGKVGRNVTIGPFSGIGRSGRRDRGAGGGVPVLEDGVVLEPQVGILGGILVPRGTRIPAGVWMLPVRGGASGRD
jgi:O-antigen/teichoic acid export membrane protein/serine acetyltransferase